MKDIIYLFYSYVTDFIKMWLVLWGLLNFKPIRCKRIYVISINVQLIILILNVFIYKINHDTAMFISLGTVVIMITILFEDKYIKKLSHAILAYVLILFLDACTVTFSSLLTNVSAHDFINYSIIPYIYNTLNIFTIILLIK